MASSAGEKKEHLYKILVIGELGTGKTSLIKRYVHNLYSPNYRATVSTKLILFCFYFDFLYIGLFTLVYLIFIPVDRCRLCSKSLKLG
jgi:hypothetical protein